MICRLLPAVVMYGFVGMSLFLFGMIKGWLPRATHQLHQQSCVGVVG